MNEKWRRIVMKNIVRIRIDSYKEKREEKKVFTASIMLYIEAKEIEKRLRHNVMVCFYSNIVTPNIKLWKTQVKLVPNQPRV